MPREPFESMHDDIKEMRKDVTQIKVTAADTNARLVVVETFVKEQKDSQKHWLRWGITLVVPAVMGYVAGHWH